MKIDILNSEKGKFLKNIDNLKYKIDELEKLMSKIKFYNIDEIRELSGEIYAINIIIESLISFTYIKAFIDDEVSKGDDEK
jgi:hypothetical protein